MRTLLLLLLIAVPAAATQDVPNLKDEVDLSVRWLRSQQDRRTGAYGPGVESTAQVLRALAHSPRHYVRRDGPYVADALDYLIGLQDDAGWIADKDAPAEVRVAQTRAAAAAFYLFVDGETTAALGKSVAWLAEAGISDPAAREPVFTRDKAVAGKRIAKLIAERRADGSWGGDLDASARAVLELSAYYPLFKTHATLPAGAKPLPKFVAADKATVDAAISRGARFLLGAATDGRWGSPDRADAGLTSMVIGALQAVPEPRPKDIQTAIDDGLDWLVSLQPEDGSIHQGMLANYVTSAAVLALSRSAKPEHRAAVLRARGFLLQLQADEGEGYSPDHPFYGGIGYGGDERPDLSNLQMALEALVASGLDSNDEAFTRAVRFLERCQNRSESNDVRIEEGGTVTLPGDDGGAGYFPGESKAGFIEMAGGKRVPRSYGSMTYALLKGFVFAGLKRDDPRVEACWKWLQEHYTLDLNPGFEHSADPTAAYQGLFYYFHSMARALNVYGADTIETPDGQVHPWRPQLAGRLIAMQSKIDGSWVNENAARWWEGNPVLATSYVLLTLAETKQ
jgi:Prenyltransferase and squalene oxidase repeat